MFMRVSIFEFLIAVACSPGPACCCCSLTGAPATVLIATTYVEQPPQVPDSVHITAQMNQASLAQLQASDVQGFTLTYSLTALPDPAIGAMFQVPSWVKVNTIYDNGTVDWVDTRISGNRRLLFVDEEQYAEAASDEFQVASSGRRLLSSSTDVNTPTRAVDINFPLGAPMLFPTVDLTAATNFTNSSSSLIEVTHPAGYVAFVPLFGAAGVATLGYTVSNGNLKAAQPIPLEFEILKVFQKPRADEYAHNLVTTENIPLIIRLYYTFDDSLNPKAKVLQLVSSPENGTVCEVTPRVGLSQPCGDSYGPALAKGTPITDANDRVVYIGGLNRWGSNFDHFSFNAQDELDAVSNTAVIGIDVTFENQPPVATGQSAYEVDFALTTNVTVELVAVDPDNTYAELTYSLTEAPQIGWLDVTVLRNGLLETVPVNASILAEYQDLNGHYSVNDSSLWIPDPFLIASRFVTFDSGGQGASYPYARFSYSVHDPDGLRSDATWQLVIKCSNDVATKSPQYPNVWTEGLSTPTCIVCPHGASCSLTGAYKPKSLDGYWQSQQRYNSTYTVLTLTADGQPIYLVCSPPSACSSADYGADGCDTTNGYEGRRCAACLPSFHTVDGGCSQCTKTEGSVVIIVGLIMCVVVFAAIFVFVMAKLQIDVSFFAISFNFFQAVATFKDFKLNWPGGASSALTSIAAYFKLNPDLISNGMLAAGQSVRISAEFAISAQVGCDDGLPLPHRSGPRCLRRA